MKLLLVTVHLEHSTRSIPLAAACLKAVVTNHDVEIKNYYLEQSAEEISQDLMKENPDVIGFSVYLWNRPVVVETIAALKKSHAHIKILAGGPEVSADPGGFLNSSLTDIVMEGEGELIISGILDAISEQKPIPSLAGIWTENLKPAVTAVCHDFNALPSPILSGALDLSQNTGLLWELSRGCPFACEFCFESKGLGTPRTLKMDRIVAELEMIRDNKITQVFVLDPTFNTSKKRVLEILKLLAEYTPETYYYFEIRSEFLDEETAEAFSTIPCTLQIGLQSSSDRVLRNVNRSLNPEDFREKMELLSRYGISYGLDLIYGLPGESLDGFRESISYALSLEPNHLDLFPLAVLPGTVLFDHASDFKLRHQKSDPYLILESDRMTTEDIKKAGILSDGTNELYNTGKAVSWFCRACFELELKAVVLIEQWLKYKKTCSLSINEESIQECIVLFLKDLYEIKELYEEFRVIRDLIQLLDIQSFLEELPETALTPEDGVELKEECLISLHPSVRIESFGMHPLELLNLLESGSGDITEEYESSDSNWIFWSREWEFCLEQVDDDRLAFLNYLKSPRQISDIKSLSDYSSRMDEIILESILEGYVQIL
ncbi:MAG: hypothetical protein B6241_11430 [Spirochaetaceae bacterium 4572_59]|nr:MAG: hypothetical protein B6241_11430 [Spirochaetaceae bacterium 4572_59]